MPIWEADWVWLTSLAKSSLPRPIHPGVTRASRGQSLHVIIEPGRSIVGDAGVLLTRVLYRKKSGDTEFVVVDAAMNDLIRPRYTAHIMKFCQCAKADVRISRPTSWGPSARRAISWRGRDMEEAFPGDLLAVCTAGAYGFTQASNYNARPGHPKC